ncbi:hypothetical protein AAG906_027985 [Vitis piasezkii]
MEESGQVWERWNKSVRRRRVVSKGDSVGRTENGENPGVWEVSKNYLGDLERSDRCGAKMVESGSLGGVGICAGVEKRAGECQRRDSGEGSKMLELGVWEGGDPCCVSGESENGRDRLNTKWWRSGRGGERVESGAVLKIVSVLGRVEIGVVPKWYSSGIGKGGDRCRFQKLA